MKYRKKPVVIEAWQFTGAQPGEKVPDWLTAAFDGGAVWYQGGDEPYLTVRTTEGNMRASVNDWIIQGIAGELYPCKPEIFANTYEAVE